MNPPDWRTAIERALDLHGGDPASRWVQLATIALDGRPTVRTVVFRGFRGDGSTLRFTIDARGAKAGHLARDPRVEVCWCFPETREQFRLSGRATLVGPGHPDPDLGMDRATAWRELSDATRRTFAWPDPGGPRADPKRFGVAPPDPAEPAETFALLLLEASSVDHLDLRPDPHRRRLHRLEGVGEASCWRSDDVNP